MSTQTRFLNFSMAVTFSHLEHVTALLSSLGPQIDLLLTPICPSHHPSAFRGAPLRLQDQPPHPMCFPQYPPSPCLLSPQISTLPFPHSTTVLSASSANLHSFAVRTRCPTLWSSALCGLGCSYCPYCTAAQKLPRPVYNAIGLRARHSFPAQAVARGGLLLASS